jgi:hypothetical protein
MESKPAKAEPQLSPQDCPDAYSMILSSLIYSSLLSLPLFSDISSHYLSPHHRSNSSNRLGISYSSRSSSSSGIRIRLSRRWIPNSRNHIFEMMITVPSNPTSICTSVALEGCHPSVLQEIIRNGEKGKYRKLYQVSSSLPGCKHPCKYHISKTPIRSSTCTPNTSVGLSVDDSKPEVLEVREIRGRHRC